LDACFVVKDASGQKLGYFYFEEERAGAPLPSYSPPTRREGSL
jgi:hypothetical protein